MRLQPTSLRSKLSLLFLAIGLVPLVTLGWLAVARYTSAQIEASGHDVQEQARAMADRIDATLFERYGDVQAFAYHGGALGDQATIERTADFFTVAYGCYDLMMVVDLDGKILGCNTVDYTGKPVRTSGLVGQSVSGEEWFEQIKRGSIAAGKSYFSDPAPDRWVKEAGAGTGNVMNFSAPIFDESGKLVRIWTNRASCDRLVSSLLAELRTTRSTPENPLETQIVARDGTVLDDADPKAVLSLNLVEKGLGAAIEATHGKDGFTLEPHKRTGAEMINGYAASHGFGSYPGNGWGVLVRKDSNATRAEAATFRNFILIVIGAAALLTLFFGLSIARRIASPLERSATVLSALARGDFRQHLDIQGEDEIGRMAKSLNEAIQGISSALFEVRQSSVELVSAAGRVSNTTTQMSDGAQQQASALEETAASLEEITGTIKQNADSARQANQLAVASRDVAEKGSRVAADAVKSIQEISKSSEKIVNIITTIDEIAFQTNLLALNAAVEAARAGEQGRGFAVVASEVRSLAQRSAASAKEIKGLIEESLQKVQAGSEFVTRSGQSLEEIVASVKRVTDIIAEIAAASKEQATGVDQVNRAVTQMDQVVQANAGQSGELANTAQALASQAAQLQALVERFELDEAALRKVAAPATTPTPPPQVRAPMQTNRPRSNVAPQRPAPAPAAVGANNAADDGFIEF